MCLDLANLEDLGGFPGDSAVKNAPAVQERQAFSPRAGEDPLEEEMATRSSILAWRIHGQRSLVGYSLWGRTESDTTDGRSTVFH